MEPIIVAVSTSPKHTFSKQNQESITLIEGFGVARDAHAGKQVKHRYLARKDPARPNIRQVHLIHAELLDELEENGFSVTPGDLGENMTTRGLALLDLPAGTQLQMGTEVMIELTALRDPCSQIDDFQPGLLKEVLSRDDKGNVTGKTGVMGIVLAGGVVRPKDLARRARETAAAAALGGGGTPEAALRPDVYTSLCTPEEALLGARPAATCGLGMNLYIAPYGDAYPCYTLMGARHHLGNVIHEGLPAVLKRNDRYRQVTVDSNRQCRNCDLRYLCGGFCRAWAVDKDDQDNPPVDCRTLYAQAQSRLTAALKILDAPLERWTVPTQPYERR